MSVEVSAFKAKSHILSLLGDELIGSDSLAIFELVKNSYDADAEEVKIQFLDLNTTNQSIIVEDDGEGMDLNTIKSVWLEIGTDFKRGKKRKPSNKFGRTSLGEKGVGRLAVHKLGRKFLLETQKEGSPKVHKIEIDWAELIASHEYIQDLSVQISTDTNSPFPKGKGTKITISNLRKKYWSKKEIKDLTRKINTIKNPFKNNIISLPKSEKDKRKKIKDKFDVILRANDITIDKWIKEVKSVEEILSNSLYYFDFYLNENASISTYYSYSPPKNFKELKNRKHSTFRQPLKIIEDKKGELFEKNQKTLSKKDIEGIGPISGRFYVYNLESIVLNAFGQASAIKTFVRENNGVKIFRDGIRVYNYGEPSDDWMGMILRRLGRVGDKFSKNTVIGAIELNLKESHKGLVEKTNREGFDDNIPYRKFLQICVSVLDYFEKTAKPDRDELKGHIEDLKPIKKIGLSETIEELKSKLREKEIDKEFLPIVNRVQKDYNEMRDIMLNSGMSGLNLSIVFHEVEREMQFLNADLIADINYNQIKSRVNHILNLLESFSPILKQQKNVLIDASKLVETAVKINKSRFDYHRIVFSSPLISLESKDFKIKGPGNLLVSSISNIIDNAIYWTSYKKELSEEIYFKPRIWISSNTKDFNGPAIIIVDNGEGFNMPPEDLILPFRTSKPDGMGLGLYFVNMVMEIMGGALIFIDPEDYEIPAGLTGAAIALVFPNIK